MSLGNMMQIAFRLVTHWQEIEATVPQAMEVGVNVRHQLPLVQQTINDAARVAGQLMDLVNKIAPELLPQRSAFPIEAPAYDVRWLQTSLNVLIGPGLQVDGIMGPRTIEAVKKFQAAHGLVVDGWAGITTEALIAEMMSRPVGVP